jgi:hypothetical protein
LGYKVEEKLYLGVREQKRLNTTGLEQRFPNWWVASRFVVGSEKFLKCDFLIILKLKITRNGKVDKQNKIRKG